MSSHRATHVCNPGRKSIQVNLLDLAVDADNKIFDYFRLHYFVIVKGSGKVRP